jgi:cell wall-associated NlpC family hydrolase
MAVITTTDTKYGFTNPAKTLTTRVIAGTPERLEVSDDVGVLATLTKGAKTVVMRGPTRTFTENKRPFTDTFQRTVASGDWGPSGGGGNWSKSGGSDTDYSVTPGRGISLCPVEDVTHFTSVIDNLTDTNVHMIFSLNKVPVTQAASMAAVIGYTDSSNYYRARVSILTTGSVQMILEKVVAGTATTLGALTVVGSGYVANDKWHIRFERTGTTLRCRAWKDGTAEPGTWLHSFTDSSLGAGRAGTRCIANLGITSLPYEFSVWSFAVESGSWATPPTITHNKWVRVLTSPYSSWDAATEDQVRAWATDRTPDALAYATMFLTGAPNVRSAAQSNAIVMGQANYGPLDSGGLPIEGGDFHEYMGLNWTFPNGETANLIDSSWIGKMDCSGYVRMVYGYHMGLPMVRNRSADFNGLNIPRGTKDIGPSGPGVIVAQSASTAPALTDMQIGDIVLFVADTSDPVAGQIDHDGIYLGTDAAGVPRFANSRKTPNGPTFADLGGGSTLTGGGTYATSLRIIRRF